VGGAASVEKVLHALGVQVPLPQAKKSEVALDLFEVIAVACKLVFVLVVILTAVPFLVWFERRGSAWIQGRVGPNRVGPFGFLQPIADVMKFVMKEHFVPKEASAFYYHLAPALTLVAPLAAFAVIPFGSQIILAGRSIPLQITQLDVGVLRCWHLRGLKCTR